ncbi:MAG: hypothetical protein D6732_01475 [Methanobacteriota archaeon]|nr:MAG: hypothetical protein D6732_01475 [Euryarchaeota archaeon]
MQQSEYINSAYFEDEAIKTLQKHFFEYDVLPSFSMVNFLKGEFAKKLFEEVAEANYVRERNPIKYNLLKARMTPRLRGFLKSIEFKDLIGEITKEHIIDVKGQILKLGWKDYTIMHEETQRGDYLEFCLDLTPNWKQECGGIVTYYKPPDSYIFLPFGFGTLSIIHRPYKCNKFIKYVNNKVRELPLNQNRYLVVGRLVRENER